MSNQHSPNLCLNSYGAIPSLVIIQYSILGATNELKFVAYVSQKLVPHLWKSLMCFI
ncbi:hypothetical protein H6G76_34870 [Nostoc sp. FACHB-152]|uniref:hypothetical protein n=1 Tax=unclassified Nostoc TaxID=2593658 RepID=UPI00168452A0|nr:MULTISPECIES: hypothetical protein [unclassified Nostoc]MBD2452197.1 hypothetical protein [Nostoc sp. FACHB-152]MBD2473226.1 hypothetical protein [Nostoc sp. FACHB-145]